MKNMNQMRLTARHTDVTLQTGLVKITCHRVVLAMASEYFDTMFTCGLEESTSPVVQLTMEPDTLSSIVEYVYTGVIELTGDNVERLVKACDLLRLDALKAACDKFMLKHVEPTNCVGFYQFAKMYRIDQLKEKAMQVMCAQFKSVACNAEFKHLSCDELIYLIKQNDVVVGSEDVVCESVLDWVRHDLENRRSALETIIENVRLPYCSSSYLWHTKYKCDLLTPKCLEYLDEALMFQIDSVHRYETSDDGSVSLGNCVYVVGGTDGTAVKNNELSSAECFHLNERRWVPLPNMPRAVADPMVVTCNNKIYVVGGSVQGDAVSCTQVFDTTWWKWCTGSEMPEACSGCAAVVLNNSIYVVGGNERTCLKYDTSSDTWTKLTPPLRSHANTAAVVWHGRILVATRGAALSTDACEQYTPANDTWSDWTTSLDVQVMGSTVCHGLLNVDLSGMP
ncbi:hypothetical protein NP493_1171g00054 [Ridgeia piscesae]|uniref:BTB domain-containing protein n=1 Tax=Ridgeia piscesae TaxID=27915 RepID=A0AAD9NJY2_RIDPI|nr:hypothetical protein NP493_1171g00054 [Ridgeia piscesae]